LQPGQIKKEQMKVSREVDRIEGTTIYLSANGFFPKKVIIVDLFRNREYLIRKTPKGGYILV
jgi:hypothetical protein